MEIEHPPLMICEYLVSKSGQSPEAFPSRNNRCKASGGLDKLTIEQQAEVCLGPAHIHCPLRLKAKATQYAPPLGAAEALPLGENEKPAFRRAKGGKKPREDQDETIDMPVGDEFEQLVDIEEVSEPEEGEQQEKRQSKASKELPSQPFRRELEDWMRGLFKDKRSP